MSDDIASIVNVINFYAVAVDAHRYAMFERIFTEDVECDVGGGAVFTDRATLMKVFADIHAVFDATQHITSGHAVALHGDRANCLSYVSGRFRREIDGSPCVFHSTGWYDDVLVRQADGWRISRRVSRMVTYGGDIRVMQAMPGVDTKYDVAALFAEADAGRIRFFDD
jgi:ketosteroid isomerase-like protein